MSLQEKRRSEYNWLGQHCPICGAKPTTFIGRRGGAAHREGLGVETDIWKCSPCDLIFPDPMPVPKGGLGQHYDIDADEYFQSHDKQEKIDAATALVRRAEALLGGKGRLLDVGVGRGEVLSAALADEWEAEGVEPSAKFADYAEKRTGVTIWRQPIEKADIPDGSFDVVILAAVLEHLYNPDEIVEKIARVLRPGGLLFLDVPNEQGLYFKMGNLYQKLRGRDWCVNLSPTFPPFHVFGFSPRSLRKLLSKHGLEPTHWLVYPGESVLPSRGGMIGMFESLAAKAVTAASSVGEMGTYIETWAVKK